MRKVNDILAVLLALIMMMSIIPMASVPASASVAYTPRTSLPGNARSTMKYYNNIDTSLGYGNYNPYKSFDVGNCTWYAFGRAWEILGYYPSKLVFSGDACSWFSSNKRNYDSGKGGFPYSTDPHKPKLGAIACWSNDNKPSGQGGHVAVVESISNNSNGSKTIVTSESGYKSYYFKQITRKTSDKGLGWSNYTFLGYIYLGDFSTNPLEPSQPVITNIKANSNGTVTIKWTACERAKAYTLRFYKPGESMRVETLMSITSDTEYTHELPNGTYTVKVTAEGEGCWRDSDMSSEFTISPQTPEKPTITSVVANDDGTVTIKWTACKNADTYSLRFYKPGESVRVEALMSVTSDTEYRHELPNGTYTVKVTAEGDGYWRDSAMSQEFTISPKTPEKPTIKSIVNNNDGTVTVKWSDCERAGAYSLRFYKPGNSVRVEALMSITSNTEYTHALPDGTYTVKVTAEGDGHWRDSAMSEEFTVTSKMPEKPTITSVVANDDGTVIVKWTACKNAEAYSLRFYKPGESVRVEALMSVTSDTEYRHKLPNGTYTVKVTAEGDGCWKDSDMSEEFKISHKTPSVISPEISIQTPSMTTIRHKDGIKLHANIEGTAPEGSYIKWTASNGKFKTTEINGGNSLQIISDSNGKTTFTATLYSADGEVLAEDEIEITSKAGFFDKIISFFRSLFGATRIYDK